MIQANALKIPGISHGFFTRKGGHSRGLFASLNCGMGSGDDKDIVRRNRTIVAATLNVSEPELITAYQVHSPEVIAVEKPWAAGERPQADGMVTTTRGLALGILTADCGPVLFADGHAGVIGAAHAGWKGALAGVTGRTLDAMETLGAKRARTVAVVGPMISRGAYEVGPEFSARFIDDDPANQRFFTASPRAGHAMFDLAGYLEARLKREGAGEVISIGACTFSDESRFFSYRRTTHRSETDYGRQISAIAIL
ncbi:MAG TPA: peptidoglycan editing factor PgeF [Aestuariivirga sp.]|nr:peptidoglycan editing factor PgeF [Aestuariivirga sp.]